MHRLRRAQVVRRPREEVFAYFADPANLQRLTPPFLGFRILTPMPLAMRSGLLIDYRLRLFGLPFSWRTEIDTCDPPRSFSDIQLIGPYASWRHQHLFEEVEGGTQVVDDVHYRLPFGFLGRVVDFLLVRWLLKRIFDFRRAEMERHFV